MATRQRCHELRTSLCLQQLNPRVGKRLSDPAHIVVKVVDLLCPFIRGGKTGLFGGAGVGKTVLIMEFMHSIATLHQGYPCLSASEKGFGRATSYGTR